jgi:choline kinase
MKAIVLCAGQGRRLLPLTERDPKCLLPVDDGRRLLEVQLETLARCGVERASVLVGFGAERVEAFLARRPVPAIQTETLYNPFYATTDNLVTCWLARAAMTGDFVLLNGDTLFEDHVLERLLASSRAGITVTIDQKDSYDDDDMKVSLEGTRLRAIGKTLPSESVNGESIGMLCFRGAGVRTFRDALEEAIRRPDSLRAWYLSVVNELARRGRVETVSVRGLWWREIDALEDLEEVRASYARVAAEAAAAPRDAALAAR